MNISIRLSVLVGLCIMFLSIVLLFVAGAGGDESEVAINVNIPVTKVDVISAKTSSLRATVTAHGTVRARWVSDINSRVPGYIESVSPSLRRGKYVEEGETLVKLADFDYHVSLSSAELDLASATTALLMEKEKHKQAQRDTKVYASSNGARPASSFALRIPQLKEAEANHKAKTLALEKAKKDIVFTEIKAPFSGVILDYKVGKGEWVDQGQELLRLASIEELYIYIPLSSDKWRLLDVEKIKEGIAVDIRINSYSNKVWKGEIREYIPAAEQKTGNLALIVEVTSNIEAFSASVPINAYAEVSFSTKQLDDVVKLPESGLVNTRVVWAVDEGNRVRKLPMEILQYEKKSVVVRYAEPQFTPQYLIVKAPVKITEGQLVEPNLLKQKAVLLSGAH